MKKILILVALSLITATATAEIMLENKTSGGELIAATSPTSLTLSGFDAGTAADTYIVVAVATKMPAGYLDNPVTSVTFGGTGLTKISEELVNDSYEGWAILYGGSVSGTGDVVVNYTPATSSDDHDAVGVSVASYSDVSGADANSGVNDNGSPSSLTDSITTTNDNSLIVSCLMLGGPAASVTGQGSTTVVQRHGAPDKIDGGLLSLAAPTAGTYGPDVTFSGQNRASMCSAELVEQAAPKATTFIVR